FGTVGFSRKAVARGKRGRVSGQHPLLSRRNRSTAHPAAAAENRMHCVAAISDLQAAKRVSRQNYVSAALYLLEDSNVWSARIFEFGRNGNIAFPNVRHGSRFPAVLSFRKKLTTTDWRAWL